MKEEILISFDEWHWNTWQLVYSMFPAKKKKKNLMINSGESVNNQNQYLDRDVTHHGWERNSLLDSWAFFSKKLSSLNTRTSVQVGRIGLGPGLVCYRPGSIWIKMSPHADRWQANCCRNTKNNNLSIDKLTLVCYSQEKKKYILYALLLPFRIYK